MNSTTTGQIAGQLTTELSSYFTDNIGIVITFVVGFMVLSVLWRMVSRGTTLDGVSAPQFDKAKADELEEFYSKNGGMSEELVEMYRGKKFDDVYDELDFYAESASIGDIVTTQDGDKWKRKQGRWTLIS